MSESKLDEVKAKLAAASKEVEEDVKEAEETKEALEDLKDAVEDLETPTPELWHKFKSARRATRLVTEGGVVINFTNYQHITKHQEVIDYLMEFASASNLVTYVGTVDSLDADPMIALRRQFYEEFKREQAGSTGIMTSEGVASA